MFEPMLLEVNPAVLTIVGVVIVLVTPRRVAVGVFSGTGMSLCLLALYFAFEMKLKIALFLIGYALLWTVVVGPVAFARKLREDDGSHWMERGASHLYRTVVPTAGIDPERGTDQGTPPPDAPGGPPRHGDRQHRQSDTQWDMQCLLGVLDALLTPTREDDQRRQQPQPRHQQPGQPDPEDYNVVPDEELFGDVDEIDDQYRQ